MSNEIGQGSILFIRSSAKAVLAEIASALEEADEEVKMSNLGNFNTKDKVAHPGRNPKTGARGRCHCAQGCDPPCHRKVEV